MSLCLYVSVSLCLCVSVSLVPLCLCASAVSPLSHTHSPPFTHRNRFLDDRMVEMNAALQDKWGDGDAGDEGKSGECAESRLLSSSHK